MYGTHICILNCVGCLSECKYCFAEQKSPTECCGDEFVVVGGQLADCVYWLLLANATPTQPPNTYK